MSLKPGLIFAISTLTCINSITQLKSRKKIIPDQQATIAKVKQLFEAANPDKGCRISEAVDELELVKHVIRYLPSSGNEAVA